MSDAANIRGSALWFMLGMILVRFILQWKAPGTRIDLLLATSCLCTATIADIVLWYAPTLGWFKIGMYMANVSNAHMMFTRSLLATESTTDQHVRLFTWDQLFHAVGIGAGGVVLHVLYMGELGWNAKGFVYIVVTVFCALGCTYLLIIIIKPNIKSVNEDKNNRSQESREDEPFEYIISVEETPLLSDDIE